MPFKYSDITVPDISIAQDARSKSFHSKEERGVFEIGLQKFKIAFLLPGRYF
jgi:hypothetical protein